jgi:hypothetical protein
MAFDQYERRFSGFVGCATWLPRPKNLALFLPFADTKVRQRAATSGKRFSRNAPMFIGAHAASGNFRQHNANAGKGPENPLLTGGLLVRIQPEEPNRLKSITYGRRFRAASHGNRRCPFLALFPSQTLLDRPRLSRFS